MTKAEKILENLLSIKIGLDDHYGRQTVLNALNQALSMSGVSVSLLQKAYDLIPDGTSHEDLIEIKKALFSNEL